MLAIRKLAILCLALASMPLAAQTPAAKPAAEILPFDATEKTLPNGLKVIIVPTGFPNIVSLYINVQTGSRNEVEPGKSGFAHFFEHMMFRGTEKFPNEKYQEIMTKSGARTNANTWDDRTIYHMTFAKEDLETMLMVEADRFENLDYSVEDFKTEARAVLGEYNKNSANPISKLFEVQRDSAYDQHTYKHTTMGFLEDIEDMPNQFEYSKLFFDRWYRPEYTTIIVAGDVDAARAIPLVEKYWGGWERGSFKTEIPVEPAPKGPEYAHVPWETATLPWVSVGFHAPAFQGSEKEYAAMDTLLSLWFGPTSELYKKLVQQEQIVDTFGASYNPRIDPTLATIIARLKKPEDAVYVRDQILATVATARTTAVESDELADAISNARYQFVRGLDNTESIATVLAEFAQYERAYGTINRLYAAMISLTPADLQNVARTYLTDERMIVTTLSHQPLAEGIAQQPRLASFVPASSQSAGEEIRFITQKSVLPQINMKLQFDVGSAHDPAGKEGLARLAASMIAGAGSKSMRIDEINQALFPMAGTFGAQVDREMTTFTGRIHTDNWKSFLDIVLDQLMEPGLRAEDFQRLKDAQKNALVQDLRANNDEELGKERLQWMVFRGTPYGHPVVGTEAGIDAITIDDVRDFVTRHYSRGNLTVGLAGNAPDALVTHLRRELGTLPGGNTPSPTVAARAPQAVEVEIIDKSTRAVAISLGFPIAVTRSHPDFAALSVARAWLGEHRSSMSHLYKRIREVRGMNYGNYAYIEAFPGGMFTMTPNANVARRAQIFEIWIRPVVPENPHMALRIAIHELQKLVESGLTAEQFETAREYLMKNVYVLTSDQNRQIGYALDSEFYGIPEYTQFMRSALSKLTVDDVNRAVKKHLQWKNLFVVVIADDATGLKQALVSDQFSPIKYDAEKPAALLEEDQIIGARKLNIPASRVTITPVENVFAK
ncbi:MAG TPA: pitrilysin family protein [Thermoanaerobaculia bacterium]|nr:pitrilysin family protein [Thermoanaerobaculia bacterium]